MTIVSDPAPENMDGDNPLEKGSKGDFVILAGFVITAGIWLYRKRYARLTQ